MMVEPEIIMMKDIAGYNILYLLHIQEHINNLLNYNVMYNVQGGPKKSL